MLCGAHNYIMVMTIVIKLLAQIRASTVRRITTDITIICFIFFGEIDNKVQSNYT